MPILKPGNDKSMLMSLSCSVNDILAAYSSVALFSSVGLFSSFKGEKTITQKWEVILYVHLGILMHNDKYIHSLCSIEHL